MPADFSGREIVREEFGESDLSNANFEGAKIDGCKFVGTKMRGANFRCAEIGYNTVFDRVDIAASNFENVSFRGVHFNSAHMNCSTFANSTVLRLVIRNSGAVDVNFTNVKGTYFDATQTNFIHSDLSGCVFEQPIFKRAEFQQCKMHFFSAVGGLFTVARFYGADLDTSNLRCCDFTGASFFDSSLSNADISASRVFATSIWKTQLNNCIQDGLVVTPELEPAITIDNIELAQFIYMMSSNTDLRNIIDTITSRVVSSSR